MQLTTGSPKIARRDSSARLKLRVSKAFETMKMKKAAADGAIAIANRCRSLPLPPLSPSLLLSTVGTDVKKAASDADGANAIPPLSPSQSFSNVETDVKKEATSDGASASRSRSLPPLSPSLLLSTVGTDVKKEANSDSASASMSIPPLSPSLSLSTVGTVKTVYFGEVEEIERRDEICHVDADMESMREVEDKDTLPELPNDESSLSILTEKASASDFTNNLPAISRSISTAATSFWQSVASNNPKILDHLAHSKEMEYLSTDSTTTTSTSDDFFNLGCPVAISLSYSGNEYGLEIVPLDTMTLSMSNSLAYNESIEDTREVEDTDALPELPNAESSLSILTEKASASDFTNNLPAISRSISTAGISLRKSVATKNSKISDHSAHSTEYLSTDSSTTTSTSNDFFNLGCPVDMSLSYSGSEYGLEVVPLDTMMLSMSNSLAYNESIEDTVVTVNDNHAQLGCLVAMKDLTDDITLAAREVRNFYNSPRKSVTFTHYMWSGGRRRGWLQP